MKNKVLFVGIACYNNQSTIFETINSLKNQSFTDWRCVISDDSRDENTMIAALAAIKDDERFTYILNDERLGEIGNYRQLISLCDLPYIKILCGDDIIYPNSIEVAKFALDESPTAVLATGNRDVIRDDGKVFMFNRGYKYSCVLTRSEVIKNFVKSGGNSFGEVSFAIFKSVALKESQNNIKSEFGAAADMQLFLNVLEHGDLVHVNKALGGFRIWGGSGTAASNKKHRSEALELSLWASFLPASSCTNYDRLLTRFMVPLKARLRSIIYWYLT